MRVADRLAVHDIKPSDPLRLAVAAAIAHRDGSMTASGLRREATKRRLVIERAAAPRAARLDLKRTFLAESQQFDRALTTHWRTVGMRARGRRMTSGPHIRLGGGADQPHYGKIKAARCGPVGWPKNTGISAPWNEVHFSPRPAFSDNAGKIKAGRTSRAAALSKLAVRAGRSVPPRTFRPFGSALGSWHTAAMACPDKSRQFVASPGREK
jgi:hypothetical protein